MHCRVAHKGWLPSPLQFLIVVEGQKGESWERRKGDQSSMLPWPSGSWIVAAMGLLPATPVCQMNKHIIRKVDRHVKGLRAQWPNIVTFSPIRSVRDVFWVEIIEGFFCCGPWLLIPDYMSVPLWFCTSPTMRQNGIFTSRMPLNTMLTNEGN